VAGTMLPLKTTAGKKILYWNSKPPNFMHFKLTHCLLVGEADNHGLASALVAPQNKNGSNNFKCTFQNLLPLHPKGIH